MHLRRRFLSVASAAVALIGVLALTGISPASAQTAVHAQRLLPGNQAWAYSMDVGYLLMTEENNGYNAEFYSNLHGKVDFTLWTQSGYVGDRGATEVYPNNYISYFFATGYQQTAYLCLYSRDTPPAFPRLCTFVLYG